MLCISASLFLYQQKSIYLILWMSLNMEKYSEYQKEQQEAFEMVQNHLDSLSREALAHLQEQISAYLAFRHDVDCFLDKIFQPPLYGYLLPKSLERLLYTGRHYHLFCGCGHQCPSIRNIRNAGTSKTVGNSPSGE